MASRYSRYEPDRRSRSPGDRSLDRFERSSQYGDGDRRRSSAEARSTSSGFQPSRDSFGDPNRREPPRGPKALVEPPSGPRGGGFAGDLRGSRGRARGRAWPARDDSRDRERERDTEYRDRYRDDRSRERDRDRDRDRDSRDFRSRRSPGGRARSPVRDFRDRDRDRDGPPGVDVDRARRDSRDGGPPSAGSTSSDPQFGMTSFGRGGYIRGRGRGGRGDWPSVDRGRGRTTYDDRGDRYPRSRSKEGRWGRERDERDRGDRYPDPDARRELRDRDLIRSKKDSRPANPQDLASQSREVSPLPVAPSAPAFGSVPSRNPSGGESSAGTGKPPPTAPRAFGERPVSAGKGSATLPAGPSRSLAQDHPPIPVGPRAQQQRPSSKQWINPNLKKAPESPKIMRSQTFAQSSSASLRRGSGHADQQAEHKRPGSSDANPNPWASSFGDRARSHHSAEPGEITVKLESEACYQGEPGDQTAKTSVPSGPDAPLKASNKPRNDPSLDGEKPVGQEAQGAKRKRKKLVVPVVRFALPPKVPVPEQDSESDDDDMADYFDMKIRKTEAELTKLPAPSLPRGVLTHYAVMSHGSMVQILREGEGLTSMLGPLPEGSLLESGNTGNHVVVEPASVEPTEPRKGDDAAPAADEIEDGAVAGTHMGGPTPLAQVQSDTKTEEMDMHVPSVDTAVPDAPSANFEPHDEIPRASASPEAVAKEEDAPARDGGPHVAPLETAEQGSKPPSTPSQVPDEDDEETETEDEAYMDVETVRQFMKTPPVDSLPDYSCPHWEKDDEFLATLEPDPAINDFVTAHIHKVHAQEAETRIRRQKEYAENYVRYLNFTMSQDPVAVKSRDKFSVAVPAVESGGAVTPETKPEGRGTGRRFATERDLERVLQASMREDEERRERELRAKKEKYRSDKEAVIPDMLSRDELLKAQYIDRSGFTPQDRLVSSWHVLPPVNNFTQEEAELFEKRYLELPKQWGKVAEFIPNRDFGTCIQYYYSMKKDLNLKEKLKKQPKRRKKGGRGKQRSSALVSELGNGEQEGEENPETGENGERRRPRRAAAPTWGVEQPATDSENATPAGTPGRRGAPAAATKGEQPEKPDGRKGRRKAAKEKEPKVAKANQSLAAAPTPTGGRGRSRSGSRAPNSEFPAPATPDTSVRMPAPFEQQPPFPVQQQPFERPKPLVASSISEVMAAPSLRPEPPPPPLQPSMTTFNLTQPQTERKAPTQASSYWSVSEANDFPHLLRAFGSDWTSIAAHMGFKTAVMVKNYFVRQKDGKAEWEAIVQEADAKRVRGEKRPDPPQPTVGGRGRRYENTAAGASRPLAVAPGIELQTESPQPKVEALPQQPRLQAFPGYGVVPIAQAPTQQPLAQPAQQPMAIQQHAMSQPAPQVLSPPNRPLRAPLQPFGFPEREAQQPPQREREREREAEKELEKELEKERERARERERDRNREREREREKGRERERERERELARMAEHQAMRVNQELELAPQRHYDPYGHRPQPGLGREPLSLGRPPSQDPSRSGMVYPPPVAQQQQQQQQAPHAVRNLMGESAAAHSPPLGPPSSRPMPSLQNRPPSRAAQDSYSIGPPAQAAAPQAAPKPRPPEPRKTSNIMSLLNDDPLPAAKRVSDVSGGMSGPLGTPPPQSLSRTPGPAPQMRREPEPQYSPYGRVPSGGASAMPPLKPTYTGSPSPAQHMGSASAERDYYRQHAYTSGHHSSGTNSPQASHRYPAPSQSAQPQYQTSGGYHATYVGGAPVAHAASPLPQYAVHGSASRTREVPQGGRENSWPHQGHQQPPSNMQQGGGWPAKSQGQPPPQQAWVTHSNTPTPSTQAQSWSSAPPPQQAHHMGMRDERGAPVYAGSSQPPQHRYAAPVPRGPESMPPQGQPYPRYASTPGPVAQRDPREQGRSYTPGLYDGRGPPPPPGAAYPGQDPREMQLRDGRDQRDPRDPREMMSRGLRPHEYERHPDRYGR